MSEIQDIWTTELSIVCSSYLVVDFFFHPNQAESIGGDSTHRDSHSMHQNG